MIPARDAPPPEAEIESMKAIPLALPIAVVVLVWSGCGSAGIEVKDRGAQLFADRCSGCHTLKAAGAVGSQSGQRPTGPNLNKRKLSRAEVLFAIRNGGFSGAIMPQNVVVGKDAEAVASFVSKYAGTEASSPPAPEEGSAGGTGATSGAGQSAGGNGGSGKKAKKG
jgi:mono/diheme cytochrome c family protein